MNDEQGSRWLNGVLWGDPDEMFCARCYRRREWFWWLVLAIDFEAWRRHGEPPGHCRRRHERERLRRLALPDRFRYAAGA